MYRRTIDDACSHPGVKPVLSRSGDYSPERDTEEHKEQEDERQEPECGGGVP
jgi:hypothetical protein